MYSDVIEPYLIGASIDIINTMIAINIISTQTHIWKKIYTKHKMNVTEVTLP